MGRWGVSQKEIAEKLGVSRATVSKILNEDPKHKASTEMVEKVLETARKLGYDFHNLYSKRNKNKNSKQTKRVTVVKVKPWKVKARKRKPKLKMKSIKKDFTVGEIAKICNVARSTVIYWIKNGLIEASQTKGGFNRVPYEALEEYLANYGYPPDYLYEYTNVNILLVDNDLQFIPTLKEALKDWPQIKIHATTDIFKAGLLTQKLKPCMLILKVQLNELNAMSIVKALKDDGELRGTAVMGLSEDGGGSFEGFDTFYTKPYRMDWLIHDVLKAAEKGAKRRYKRKEGVKKPGPKPKRKPS